MNKIAYMTCVLSLAFTMQACDDFLDSFPQDTVTNENFWKSKEDADKVLVDIYASLLPKDAIFLMRLCLIMPIWYGIGGEVLNKWQMVLIQQVARYLLIDGMVAMKLSVNVGFYLRVLKRLRIYQSKIKIR
ncbi:hypothetical protein NXW77_18765 [Bacteroides fragilis]|nr:hypothetical protein [Bacteroides fragilis]